MFRSTRQGQFPNHRLTTKNCATHDKSVDDVSCSQRPKGTSVKLKKPLSCSPLRLCRSRRGEGE